MARLWGGRGAAEAPRWWQAGVVLALLALAAVAWSGLRPRFTDSPQPGWQRIRDSGVLRVGYAVEAPYAFVDGAGEVTGESPELARMVAHELGVKRIEWVQVPFDALITELLADRFDVVAAGLFVTPERQARVLFSDPTLRVGAGLLVRLADASQPQTRQGMRVAVVQGSVERDRLPHWLPAAVPVPVPDVQTARAALLVGEADAVALSWPTLARLAQTSQGELVAFRLPAWPGAAADHIGFAFQPAQRDLRDAWNAAQQRVLGGATHLAVLQRFNLGAADLAATSAMSAASGARP